MTMQSSITADKQAHEATTRPAAEYFLYAARQSGRSAFALGREFRRLSKAPGKLTLDEYIRYGVYRPEHSDEDRARFVSNKMHWPLVRQINPMTFEDVCEDKFVSSKMFEGSGIPTPHTLAVIDKGPRLYPGLPKVSDDDGLNLLAELVQDGPLFCKEVRGICSFGVLVIDSIDATHVHLRGRGAVTRAAFLSDAVGDAAMLVQRMERIHPALSAWGDTIPTVRVVMTCEDDAVRLPITVIKLPTGDNLADSFWRPGNISCDVDPETGVIRTARRKTELETEHVDTHPTSCTPIIGTQLPGWDALQDLARTAARIHQPLRYQTLDVALTDRGPVLIEINAGGGFDLLQMAMGKGVMNDAFRAFWHRCGLTDL